MIAPFSICGQVAISSDSSEKNNKSKVMCGNTIFSNLKQAPFLTWLECSIVLNNCTEVMFHLLIFLFLFFLALQKQCGWDSELFGLRCLVRKNKNLFVINPENELCWQAVFTGFICICCINQHHHHCHNVIKTYFHSHTTPSRQLVEACFYAFTYQIESYLLHLL